ncbi:MAG TPA: inorganic phosphate transporter [Thermodesulfobacteriota bacterium]|nr:inorganic phosphate transporter [Thermodesulfobacteriota bacterium]
MGEPPIFVIVAIILVAVAFDFINGFHDTANSISTVVSTRVLSPRLAVLFAALFNFAAFFVVGTPVANLVGSGIVSPSLVTENKHVGTMLVLSALLGAISWDLITWYFALPTSSSHALIGGLIGAGVAAGGFAVINARGIEVVVKYMVLSPVIGLAAAFGIMSVLYHLLKKTNPRTVNRYFRFLQILSSSGVSFSHGSNDAQKTMGVITLLLLSAGKLPENKFEVPDWVALLGYTTLALGTLAGGWRIIKTMGMRITHLQPVNGFAAETAAALVIFGSSWGGIPVSTTHVVAGSIMGVGATKRASAVRWGVARRIVWAWVVTIPVSAAIGGVAFLAAGLIFQWIW